MQTYPVFEESFGSDDMLEYVFADVGVDCAQSVIDEIDVGSLIDGSGQIDALSLTTTQVASLQSHIYTLMQIIAEEQNTNQCEKY
jgi:hypothetical protein